MASAGGPEDTRTEQQNATGFRLPADDEKCLCGCGSLMLHRENKFTVGSRRALFISLRGEGQEVCREKSLRYAQSYGALHPD